MPGFHLSYRGLFWRYHPSPPEPCPAGVTRTFIETPNGSLEVLSAGPVGGSTNKSPIFFAHGGMGSAFVWAEYLQYFGSLGIPCYAISLRGHGNSWHPSFLRMVWGTTKQMLAGDLIAGIRYAEEKESREVILVGHSSGGGLSQLILSNGDVKAKGLALLGAVPAFGSYASLLKNPSSSRLLLTNANRAGVYVNWMSKDPFLMIRMILQGYHPNSPLSHPALTKQAFFCEKVSDSYVEAFHRRLSPFESFLWPFGMLLPFATPARIVGSVVGSAKGLKILVMGGERDIMTTPDVMRKLASRLREAIEGRSSRKQTDGEKSMDATTAGVRCVFVEGAGHHLQNDVQWKDGARKLFEFYERVQE